MALLQQVWAFDVAPPAFDAIGAEVERRMGAPAVLSERDAAGERRRRRDRAGRIAHSLDAVDFVTLSAPIVCRCYGFEMTRRGRTIAIEAGTPAHPFLWAHLEGALRALGGRLTGPVTAALHGDEALARPWGELDALTRLELGPLADWLP